jgi:hypothetical protein
VDADVGGQPTYDFVARLLRSRDVIMGTYVISHFICFVIYFFRPVMLTFELYVILVGCPSVARVRV